MPVIEKTSERAGVAAVVGENGRVGHPFVAVVGCRAAKQALLLLAIEPGLRGALIASPSGSDESGLARAFGSIAPAQASDGVRWPADPASSVVELPLSVTEERLLGGLDLERTIATGRRVISPGLLAKADRRVLYANDVNLLDSGAAAHVARALDSRRARVEREGLTAIHDADFTFVGTYNSEEGEPNSLLRDRVGLIVESLEQDSADEKRVTIERALRFDRDPFRFADGFAAETAQLERDISSARERLPRVSVSKDQLLQISQIAIRLGVEGNRADVFAVKAARASAALAGRDAVTEDDLAAAVQLVLVPRATTLPQRRDEIRQQNESSPQDDQDENNRSEGEEGGHDSLPGAIEDMIIQAMDARPPEDLLSAAQPALRRGRGGKRFNTSMSARGRYVRSAVNRIRDARIAIDATLRAAAPFQLTRRAQSAVKSPRGGLSDRRVRIEPGDLRFKELKHRTGILFIFAVDASGSMALNRMAQAKGALTRLLQQAYRHRDQVALISFRGESSDVLLAPTRSVELAKSLVDALPAGGGTPVSAGVVKAIDLARLARLRGSSQAMLILFTDGRANVGLGRAVRTATAIGEELRRLGGLLASEHITSVVVDTRSKFVSGGEGEGLARTLGARYLCLPRSDAETIYDAITSIAGRRREK